MTKQYIFSQEQYDALNSLTPNLSSVISQLREFVAPNILKNIEQVYSTVNTVLDDFRKIDELENEKNSQILENISNEHEINVYWDVSQITADKINDLMPFEIGTLMVREKSKEINKNLTWLQAWKEVDNLVSEDSDHVFVENFTQNIENPKIVEVCMGS